MPPCCNCCCRTESASGSSVGDWTSLPLSMAWRLLWSIPQHSNFAKADLQDSIKPGLNQFFQWNSEIAHKFSKFILTIALFNWTRIFTSPVHCLNHAAYLDRVPRLILPYTSYHTSYVQYMFSMFVRTPVLPYSQPVVLYGRFRFRETWRMKQHKMYV